MFNTLLFVHTYRELIIGILCVRNSFEMMKKVSIYSSIPKKLSRKLIYTNKKLNAGVHILKKCGKNKK